MRFIAFLIILQALCMGQTRVATAQAVRESSLATVIAADASAAQVELVPWAFIVKDDTGEKTVEEVMRTVVSDHQSSPGNEVFSAGFSKAAYWFVVPLENSQNLPLKRLLVLNPSWLDDVRLTLIDARGAVQTFTGGDIHPFAQRSELYRRSNFLLDLPPGRSTLAVRITTRDPFWVGLSLMRPDMFNELVTSESLYFGLVYGALLALFLFHAVLYLSSRDKEYLAYCAFVAAFLLMHATYNGHFFRWLWPASPALSNWAHSVLIYLYCFQGLVFAMVFLDLKQKLPIAYLWTRRLIYAMGLSFAITALLAGYRGQVISSILWVVVFSVVAFALGLLSLRRRNAVARLYLIGSTGGLVCSSITALTTMGIIPYSFWTFRAVDFGMLLDAIMLSLALSARLGQARRLERLRRFFSPAVANQLLSASSEELYAPHHREIVVLFLDLRGYTAFTQKHGADEVMRILGEFHAAMGEIIATYEATLERFAGDGMMIFLNDPVEIPDPAVKAANMSLEMQARFHALNKIWQQRDYSLAMGIGIAQGMATIGAIGFEGRRDYAAIGGVTNLAARLCSEAGGGQILVSSLVAGNIEKAVRVQGIGALTLKGFPEPVACFEISLLSQVRPIESPEPIEAIALATTMAV